MSIREKMKAIANVPQNRKMYAFVRSAVHRAARGVSRLVRLAPVNSLKAARDFVKKVSPSGLVGLGSGTAAGLLIAQQLAASSGGEILATFGGGVAGLVAGKVITKAAQHVKKGNAR